MNDCMDYLKDEYLKLSREIPKIVRTKHVYTAEMILKLKEMADNDVYPDARFSVEEVELWSAFNG